MRKDPVTCVMPYHRHRQMQENRSLWQTTHAYTSEVEQKSGNPFSYRLNNPVLFTFDRLKDSISRFLPWFSSQVLALMQHFGDHPSGLEEPGAPIVELTLEAVQGEEGRAGVLMGPKGSDPLVLKEHQRKPTILGGEFYFENPPPPTPPAIVAGGHWNPLVLGVCLQMGVNRSLPQQHTNPCFLFFCFELVARRMGATVG